MPKDKSWGETIGEGLGQGIGSGFQALANMKMQDYAARMQQTRQNEQKKMLNDHLVKMLGPEYEGIGYQDPQVISALVRAQQQKASGTALNDYLNSNNAQNNGPDNQQPVQPGAEQEDQSVATKPQQGKKIPPNMTAADVKYVKNLEYKDKKLALDERKAAAAENKNVLTQKNIERKITNEEQKNPQKFAEGMQRQHVVNQQVMQKVVHLQKLIKKNIKKMPGFFGRLAAGSTGNQSIQDPEIREIADGLKDLVPELSFQTGQKPSVYLLELVNQAKTNITQPVKTILNKLNQIKSMASRRNNDYNYMLSLQDKQGNYPKDIASKIGAWQAFEADPFNHSPKGYVRPGAVWQENGIKKQVTNDYKWKDL